MRINQAVVFFALTVFYGTSLLAGNDEVTKQTRNLSGFNEISVQKGVDVIISQGKNFEVFVETTEKYLENVITEINNNCLEISFKGKYVGSKELQVFVTLPELISLRASEGSDVKMESTFEAKQLKVNCSEGSDAKLKVNADMLECYANEGSDIKLSGVFKELNLTANEGSDIKAQIETDKLKIAANEGSDIHCEGKTKDAIINANEGSDIKASGLHAENCDVKASEAVDIDIFVTGVVNVSASEASDVNISGKPKTKNIIASDNCDVRFN